MRLPVRLALVREGLAVLLRDDADTAAWLSAENVLDPSRRERARDVAEKYREALADQREADRKAHAHP